MGGVRHLAAGLCLCVLACASANIGDSDDAGPDGGFDPADARPAPIPPDAGPQTTTLSATTAPTIVPDNSVSCNNNSPDFSHTDNSYYRLYDLAAENITADFDVTSVDVAIEVAESPAGSQPLSVLLYTVSTPPAQDQPIDLATLALIGSEVTTVQNATASVVNIPIAATVPGGSLLAVEIFTPNGQADATRFFIGSNNLGEASDSYLRADDCAITSPTPASQLGVAGLAMHIIVDVTGTHF